MSRRTMRSRWTRFLPGFPAVLLVPAVLLLWLSLWLFMEDRDLLGWQFHGFGFPLPFEGWWPRIGGRTVRGFHVAPFVFDLSLALATAWLLPLALDRFVFRPIRAARQKKSATQPDSPV
jgi:hypothetical protein